MKKLTQSEIEAGGAAMSQILRFHRSLIGNRLLQIQVTPAQHGYPPSLDLVFEHGVRLIPMVDDEGNPGPYNWRITDAAGDTRDDRLLSDLRGLPIVSVGYFASNPGEWPAVTPYIELEGGYHVCCETPQGGGVIYHHRSEFASAFCQFNYNTPS